MLQRLRLPLSLLACTVGLSSVRAGSVDAQMTSSDFRLVSAADCEGVELVERRFVEDLKTKNMDDVLSLYTPGAVFIQPDSTQVIGQKALRRLYVTTFATYDSNLSLDDPESRLAPLGSSLCVHSGHYTERLRTRKDGTIAHVQGTYSFTYKRTKDGGWLFTRMRWTNGD